MIEEEIKIKNNILLPKVFVVSDSIGETAELVTRATASQFDSGNIEIVRIPYVTEEEHIDDIIEQVKAENYSIIVATIILPHIENILLIKQI